MVRLAETDMCRRTRPDSPAGHRPAAPLIAVTRRRALGFWRPRRSRTGSPGGPISVAGSVLGWWVDGARERGARRDAHLVEDVAQVGLDGLLAQEQFRGDPRVGLALDDEPGHLEFASGQ